MNTIYYLTQYRELQHGLNPSTKNGSTLYRCIACGPTDCYDSTMMCKFCNGTGWVRKVAESA